MADDETQDFEHDLDIDDTDEEFEDVDEFSDLDEEKPAAKRSQTSDKLRKKFEAEQRKAKEREGVLMGALKTSWGAEALAQYPLADLSAIGLTGINDEAKARFLDEVKAQHEAREAALAAAGYARVDSDGNPAPAAAAASAAQEVAAASAWGKPVAGTEAHPSQTQMLEKELMESMQRGPAEVIKTMFKRVPGMVDFATRRHGG